MKLNRNNFLTWEGQFTDAPFENVTNGWVLSMVENDPFIEGAVLFDDISTYGINLDTFEFTLQDNPLNPATWDAATGLVKYYPPAGVTPGLRYLKYTWRDNAGNLSPEGTITISVLARPIGWRGAPASYQCELSGGNNTGDAFYGELEKYYTDNGQVFAPYTTKPNTIGDPDYIAPVGDAGMCPIPGSTRSVNVWNFSDLPDAYIEKVTFDDGAGNVIEASPLLHAADGQPYSFAVPAATYTVTVRVRQGSGQNLHLYGGTGAGTQVVSGVLDDVVFSGFTPGTSGADIVLQP